MNILLDGNSDLQILDGNLPMVEGLDEIRQAVELSLKSFQGEWFLDFDSGIPYFQTIFKKGTTLAAIESIFLNSITSIVGVLDIQTFNLSYNPESRRLNVEFSALTTDGILEYNGEI